MKHFLRLSLVVGLLFACGVIQASDDDDAVLGKWEYRDGGFRDIHEFLPGGRMGNATGGTWAIANGELVVRWSNGWVNTYRWVAGAMTLGGTAQSPGGERHAITLVRKTDAEPISGKWEYRDGGFRDIHEFLPGGRMGNATGGTWAIANGELVVRWSNGWVNTYRWVAGAMTLGGTAQSPGGERHAITLVRKTDAEPISGKWEYRDGGFRDIHEFLPGGRMGNATGGTWAIANGELVVRWSNGWVNAYRWVAGAATLSGFATSPSGEQHRITLTRQ